MTLPAPTYDLVVLLDPQADDATRAKLVADTRTSIEGQGELLRHDDWGERALAYPIDRKSSAQYHLLQFHAGRQAAARAASTARCAWPTRCCAFASSSSRPAFPRRRT